MGGARPSRPRHWRLLVTPDREPAWNMALDEALLLRPETVPTVRFYSWEPAAISLGWFQDSGEVLPLPPGTGLVRRITGGLAIHHIGELTWSVCSPESCFPGPIEESYRRLHRALIAAIHALGGGDVHIREGEELISEGAPGTPWCFSASSHLDLVWGQRKLAGSAQRRREGRLLHHGSVPLEANPSTPENSWVGQVLGRPVAFAELARSFAATLAASLEMELEEGEIEPAEEELARTLIGEKHGHQDHIHRQVKRRHRPNRCGPEKPD